MSETPKYRHEFKYQIGLSQYYSLRQKLKVLMHPDSHANARGEYLITSLYFDNCYDKALQKKMHGNSQREKFRIRYYEKDLSLMHLEKKQKNDGLCLKSSAPISADQCRRILDGDWQWLLDSDQSLLQELGFKMSTQLLRPRTVVSYTREPYVYGPGNVRVTFDKNITSSLAPIYFLDPTALALSAGTPGTMILEVKYDEFLPEMIRNAIEYDCTRLQSFSKYAECRYYEY